MTDIALAGRLLLLGVFSFSGLTKLLDRNGTGVAVRAFGAPDRLVTPVTLVLPFLEIGLAFAMTSTATAVGGAIGMAVLLGVFMAAIAAAMARGTHPDCHCFGQIHSAPVGWRTLIRNLVLCAVAVLVVLRGPGRGVGSVAGEMGAGPAAVALAMVFVVATLTIQAWVLVNLWRQNGRLLLRIEALESRHVVPAAGRHSSPRHDAVVASPSGLPVGVPAPDFSLDGLHGEHLTLSALRASARPLLLMFTDPGCQPCTSLLPDVDRWQSQHGSELAIALISRGGVAANLAKTSEHGIVNVLLQDDFEVADEYRVGATPSAVLIDNDGVIASPVVVGPEPIRRLVASVLGQDLVPSHLPATLEPSRIGLPAPPVRLPDLNGIPQGLPDLIDGPTVVLFWNPNCGFCQQLTDDIKVAEGRSEHLVVVSSGSVEANSALGFRSPVLLDHDFNTGRQFGASGTPSAVMVDGECRIASQLAIGGTMVMALLARVEAEHGAAPTDVGLKGSGEVSEKADGGTLD